MIKLRRVNRRSCEQGVTQGDRAVTHSYLENAFDPRARCREICVGPNDL